MHPAAAHAESCVQCERVFENVVLYRQLIHSLSRDHLEPKDGYLFIAPMVGKLGIRDAVKKLRNNVSDEVVKDTNVDPSHGAVQDSGQVR
ncbi:hypothetical protein [Bradyrhizobium zhanjiangense]|uniref:hypothetical protein n=1 Tax=Bradyrhizobium zhanjiangense TaxID=1325107 RepID=UPI00100874C9|nr:hypothetical protein [Bradyrhizobium zhanjiangense]